MQLIDQIVNLGIAASICGVLATPFLLVDKRPERLAPRWKLGISLLWIGAGFTIPLFIPEMLTALAPLGPVQVWLLYPFAAAPQGLIGAGFAGALLWLKLEEQAKRDAHHLWWIVMLFGVLWSAGAILATGVFLAGW